MNFIHLNQRLVFKFLGGAKVPLAPPRNNTDYTVICIVYQYMLYSIYYTIPTDTILYHYT